MEPWEFHEWFADYLETCNRHDLVGIRSFLDDGVRRAHLPGGADAWIDDVADLFRAFPDWQWKLIQLVVEDDRAAVHLRGGGTHIGDYHGIRASRRHVNVAQFVFVRVAGGRIVSSTGSDDAELMAQLAG